MSTDDTDRTDRFRPLPRRAADPRPEHNAENIDRELQRILDRCERVAGSGRSAFSEGTESYDVASMAIIRFAALLERPEFAETANLLTDDERAALRTTRNIAAHSGYEGMNNELFWLAVTERVPRLVRRLLDRRSP